MLGWLAKIWAGPWSILLANVKHPPVFLILWCPWITPALISGCCHRSFVSAEARQALWNSHDSRWIFSSLSTMGRPTKASALTHLGRLEINNGWRRDALCTYLGSFNEVQWSVHSLILSPLFHADDRNVGGSRGVWEEHRVGMELATSVMVTGHTAC